MTKQATVYDVARAAGVSTKTVSRVTNGASNVAQDTRERVLSAIASLGYVRNPLAHALRTGSSDTIGVVIDSISDRFFSLLVSEVEEQALGRGFSVLIASTGRSWERESSQVVRMLRQNIAALLLAPSGNDHRYISKLAQDIPVVLLDRGWELPGYDTIRYQDREGAKLATSHLAAHGHRRIGFLGEDNELETAMARRAGYAEGLEANGIALDPSLIAACNTELEAAAVARELLGRPSPPTAIFAANPRAAEGVVSVLHASGRLDVALVSFGDFALAESLSPAVTVIDQDPRRIARVGLARILERISGQRLAPCEISLPTYLIARGSGELMPLDTKPLMHPRKGLPPRNEVMTSR